MILCCICLFVLNFFQPVEECPISEIQGKILGCLLQDEEISLDVSKNVTLVADTMCVVENPEEVIHIHCDGTYWIRSDTVRNEKHVRRKRGWFFSRIVRGIANLFEGMVRSTTCVLTFFSCLWAGRAEPLDRTIPNINCEEKLIEVTAEPFQTFAKASWKEPVAKDDTDGQIKPRRNGRAPGRHFPEGYTEITYTAKDRAGNIASCKVTVHVAVVRCEEPKHLQNGYYQCHPVTEFLYGGNCKFGCYEGFDLNGPSEIQCLKTGKWSNAQPECKPWKCQALSQVEGAGYPTCDKENYFRSICTYNCHTGYDMPPKVSKTLVCDKTKNWRKFGDPKCVDVEPPVFNMSTCPSIIVRGTDHAHNSTNVSWKIPEAFDNSNITYVSERTGVLNGKRLTAGIYNVYYEAKDSAGNSAINDCSFKVVVREIRCPKLYPTPFLHIDCPYGYRTGALCNISCDPGKQLTGSDAISCSRNNADLFGNWDWKNQQQTVCENGKNCVDLKPPKNGAIACDNWEGGQYCQIQCKNGTEMSSVSLNKLYVCRQNGEWSAGLPSIHTCRPQRHSHVQHSLGLTASYYYDGDCNEPSTQQQIANNFVSVLRDSFFREACSDTDECNSRHVQITCGESGRRKRALNSTIINSVVEIRSQIPISLHGIESFAMLENKTKNILDSLKKTLKEKCKDIFGDVTVSQKEVSSRGLEIHCPDGSVKSEESWNCIDCPEGTRFIRTSNTAVCEACRKGTYQDKTAEMDCIRCPMRKTTQSIGATSINECEDACMPGSYSRDGLLPCSPCERGYYQASFGKMVCQPCRDTKSTQNYGAKSASECEEFDIEFVPDEQTDVRTTLKETVNVHDFTFSFWLQQSYRNCSSKNFVNDLPSIVFIDIQENVTLMWKNLHQIIHHNKLNSIVNFEVPNSRWHHITFYNSPSCSVEVTVDGMPLPTESSNGSCDEIPVKKIIINAEKHVGGSFSQFQFWRGKHVFGNQQRCSSKELGAILNWKRFEESDLTGAFFHFPSLCDDFNNCVSSPCIHGSCSDALHSFTCTCDKGYTGTHCDINKDDCESHICMNNATCVDGIASYSCACLANFTGQFCELEMVDGGWSEWGNWSECSTTCNRGEMIRKRLCNSPSPDNGGRVCDGENHEYTECNNTKCPVCSTISAPSNGSLECSNDTESINCTIACDDGFDFDTEPLPLYFCGPETFHEWNFQTDENPERRLPKCVAIRLPDEMMVTYTAHYRDLFCANKDLEEHSKEQIDLTVKSMLSNIFCIREQICSLSNVKVVDCDGSRRVRRSAETAGFTLQIKITPDEDNKNETLTNLENAFKNIQEAADKGEFTVEILDDEYELDGNLTDITGKVVCPSGYTRVNFYCVPCGKGAYLYTDYCKPCPIGTYQDQEGRSSCNSCPQGKSTVGIRSTSIDDCTVEELLTLENGLKVTGIVVGCACAVIFFVTVFFVYRRYKSKQRKLVLPKDLDLATPESPLSIQSKLGPSKRGFQHHLQNETSVLSLVNLSDREARENSERNLPSRVSNDGKVVHSKPWR